jgi:hypothetical protein
MGSSAHCKAQANRAPGSSVGRAVAGSKNDTPHKPTRLKSAAGITRRTTPFCFSFNSTSLNREARGNSLPHSNDYVFCRNMLFENLSQFGHQGRIELEKSGHRLFHLFASYRVEIHLSLFRIGKKLRILHRIHECLLQ